MASPAHAPSVICFGPFELDAAGGELRKGGISLKIHPQPFRVLQLLAERPRQIVSRDEIRKCLWGGNTFVDFDGGINSCLNQIRIALGDDPEKPRYIETIPRRGYRFVAAVSSQFPAERGAGADEHAPELLVVPEKNHELAGVPRKSKVLAAIIAGATALALILGFYAWTSRSAPRELRETQLTANSSDNPVTGDAISPDGKYLAYSDKQGVHLKLLATGETQTLSQISSDWYFAWYPDSTRFLGSEIARHGLWIFSVIGGTPRKFLEDGILGSVAPDGSTVAFTRNTGRVGDREVWFVGADGSNARKFLDVGEDTAVQEPWWSPDGQRIAYYTQRQLSDRFEVKVETRDLKGDAPAVIYSEFAATPEKSKLRDFNWLTAGSMVLSLAEPDSDLVNTFTVRCNLWELPIDSRSGRAAGTMKRLTNLPVGADVTYLYPTADGKRISVLRMLGSVSVYLADFDAGGRHISPPNRLTATDGWNNAPVWDRDSRAIFFESNRDGRLQIFRQEVGGDTAGLVASGTGEASVPVVSPDGAFILYVTPAHAMVGGSATPVQLMRVPRDGGPPQQILSAHLVDSPRCARGGGGLCAIAEPSEDRKQIIFTAFDVLHGRGRELARIDADPNADYGWDLSPDGTEISYIKRVPRSDGKIFSSEGPIHVLSLNGAPPREIQVKGMNEFREYVDWAANGKGLILAHPTETDAELIYVDMAGNANVLWRQKGAAAVRGVSSPDGRHLAILCGGAYNNVWMMENF
jgi:DNA-binding winged helix-turn-helix (wHTH) protein/dipeptidyl aminopeptidase/acylaminoacyl peptidase